MAISKDNIVFVYNLNSSSSVAVANYYASKHGLDTTSDSPSGNSGTIGGIDWQVDGQLVGIGITNNLEILDSETTFNTQLLTPLKTALDSSDELVNRNVWGIVLGYRLPGGFEDGSDIISSTSRISRIHHSFSKKLRNKFYNRSIFSRFDADDADIALLCSRIDGPSSFFAQTMIDNAETLNDVVYINGKFYMDAYSDRAGFYSSEYTELLEDFKDNTLPSLNLDTWSTIYMDPYIDSVIPYVLGDSFVWSWFTDRATGSFFKASNSQRVFFYNADNDGAYNIRCDVASDAYTRWPYLALNAGYVCTAGSMSNPTNEGFLNPRPFFDALIRGATIGEAYMFSLPFFNWTITLFGDPLTYSSFPSSDPVDEEVIGEHEVWRRMSVSLAKSVAHFYQKGREMDVAQKAIVDLTSIETDLELSLLYPTNDVWRLCNDQSRISYYKNAVDRLFDFPVNRYYHITATNVAPNIDLYLTNNEYRVSRLLTDVVGITNDMTSANLFPQGWWQFEFNLQNDTDDYIYYHFTLEVSGDSDFDNVSNIIFTKDSSSPTSWVYENSKDEFLSIPFDGVSSSYIGRRIRYTSRYDTLLGINEYLVRGRTYYFRVTQYNADTLATTSVRTFSDIIYT